MIRVVHLITDLTVGGAQMMLLKLLSGQKGGFEPLVISLARPAALESQISGLGIQVCNLGLRPAVPNPLRTVILRRITRSFRPHIIQGWMYHGNLAASLAGFWSPPPVSVLWNIRQTLYDPGRERPLTRAVVRLGATFSHRPSAIIYNSLVSAQQHERFGYQTTARILIPNGFDCQIFHPAEEARRQVRAELGLEDKTVVVGLIARFHPMKDHAGFLRAATIVLRSHPDVRFVLAGKGVDKNQKSLSELMVQLQLDNHVFLLGERDDIPVITAALDIACSASAWGEGFSNAIGEAMACGVPCVATDIGDSAYMIADTGLIVPPGDPGALAAAICRLVNAGRDWRQQCGQAARKRIQNEFSLPAVVGRYEALYREQSS